MSTVLRLRSATTDDGTKGGHDRGKAQQSQQPLTGVDPRRHVHDDQRHHTVVLRWNELLNIARRDDAELMANDETIESDFNLLQNVVSFSKVLNVLV